MGKLNVLAGVWKNLKELDLRPIREAAERDVRIAIVGHTGSGRHTLAEQLRSDPARPQAATQTQILITTPENAAEAANADLVILMLSSTASDDTAERAQMRDWGAAGKKVLVFHNQFDQAVANERVPEWAGWGTMRAAGGRATDRQFLENSFVPLVLEMLPGDQLALGRHFPLFRLPIARRLISESCMANASYSLGSGIAEIVPVLDLPLNVTDMLVLTKGQALLVYKLGLALGLPRDWQYYLGEFGGVLGGGFLWRQLSRSLIGLVPGLGIVPKVGIAYAGTYVVGQVVLQWYLTGRHVSTQQMQGMYRQGFQQGKELAGRLVRGAPRFHLPAIRAPRLGTPSLSIPRLGSGRETEELTPPAERIVCPACGTANELDAVFCKHCGQPLQSTA